jgi:hypothetical protein
MLCTFGSPVCTMSYGVTYYVLHRSSELIPSTGIKQRSTFWDITPWRLLRDTWRFGGTPQKTRPIFRIEEEVKQNTKKKRVRLCLLPSPCWFLAWLTLQLQIQYVPLKYRLALYGLHSAALLKTGLIIATGESLSSYTSIKQNSSIPMFQP